MELLPWVFSLVVALCSAAETLSSGGLHMQRRTGLRMGKRRPIEVSFFWRQLSHSICPLPNGELRSQRPVHPNFPQKPALRRLATLFVKALWTERWTAIESITWSIKNGFESSPFRLLLDIDFWSSISPHRQSHGCCFRVYKSPFPNVHFLRDICILKHLFKSTYKPSGMSPLCKGV